MGAYDQAARYATAADPGFVLARLRSELGMPLTFGKVLPTKGVPLPGGPDRDADLVFVCDRSDAEDLAWLLIFEAQSRHAEGKAKVLQLEAMVFLNYVKDVDRGGVDFRPLPVFIYLTGTCPEGGVVEALTPTGRGQRGRPALWEVEKDSARETLAGVASGDYSWGGLFWVPLMTGADEPEVIDLWRKLLDEKVPATMRPNVAFVGLTFADLAGCRLAWNRALGGVQMKTESAFVNEFIEQAQLENTRDNLLRFLRKRLPTALTTDVERAIADQPDLALMRTWLDAAYEATTADDFLAVLRR